MQNSFLIDIQRIVPGGRGMGFYEGQVVFAPLAVPGDRLEVLRWSDRKGFLEVLDSRLIEPSPQRVSPPCIYFGSCGGCDFQQMSNSQQLVAKQDILIDALRRIGKIEVGPSQIRLHACDTLGYRNRLQLKPMQSGKELSWGFYRMGSHEVCAIDKCLIVSNLLWEKMEIFRELLTSLPAVASRIEELEVLEGDGKECLVALALRDVPPDLDELLSQMQTIKDSLESHGLGVSLSDSRGRRHLVSGRGFVWKTVGDFRYRVSHGAFFQVNDPMLSVLQGIATQGLAGKNALELFCGVGFFTLPLCYRFERVQTIENNSVAVADLETNLNENRIENCHVWGLDLSSALQEARRRSSRFDLLLIDPPRTGLPKASVEAIARLDSQTFVYVSCDPATLARDLRILRSSGYELMSLDLLDLFPQTHHLETVARLRKP